MKIEKFKKEDKEKIKEFISRILQEIFGSPPKNLEDLDNINQNFLIFFVYKVKGKIIGVAGLKKENRKYRVSRMYIDKSKRNMGIGKRLMEELFKYCKDKKINNLFLTTYKQMNSVGFYEKMGFKIHNIKKDIILLKIDL